MCAKHSHTLAPWTKITSTKVKNKWTKIKQDAFNEITRIVARDTLLTDTYFNETFKTNTDASNFQLWAVITQKFKLIDFYRKIPWGTKGYTITDKGLLSIVETLKEFWTILLGKIFRIYTDHNNLTCNFFNSGRGLRWRLIIFESILQW